MKKIIVSIFMLGFFTSCKTIDTMGSRCAIGGVITGGLASLIAEDVGPNKQINFAVFGSLGCAAGAISKKTARIESERDTFEYIRNNEVKQIENMFQFDIGEQGK